MDGWRVWRFVLCEVMQRFVETLEGCGANAAGSGR